MTTMEGEVRGAAGAEDAHGLVAALRVRADEVQFNRAVAAVCRDEAVARALVAALLEAAARQEGIGRRARKLLARLPERLGCRDQEQVVAPVGRGMLRQLRRVGSADLAFSDVDGSFQLRVELKINATATVDQDGRPQIERYLAARVPVLVLARNRSDHPAPADPSDEHWLGVVTWQEALPLLRSLPIASAALRSQWFELLAVMEQHGDFEERRPRLPSDQKRGFGWLQDRHELVLEWVREALAVARTNGGGRAGKLFATETKLGKVRYRGGWAHVPVRLPPDGDEAISIRLRFPDPAPPMLIVDWLPPRGLFRRQPKRDHAHQRLEAKGFEAVSRDVYEHRGLILAAEVAVDGVDAVLERHIRERFAALASSGVLADDIRKFKKKNAGSTRTPVTAGQGTRG